MLFDTHVHLNADQYNDDLEEVIDKSTRSKVLIIWW